MVGANIIKIVTVKKIPKNGIGSGFYNLSMRQKRSGGVALKNHP